MNYLFFLLLTSQTFIHIHFYFEYSNSDNYHESQRVNLESKDQLSTRLKFSQTFVEERPQEN